MLVRILYFWRILNHDRGFVNGEKNQLDWQLNPQNLLDLFNVPF
jgi:hypothetical protein